MKVGVAVAVAIAIASALWLTQSRQPEERVVQPQQANNFLPAEEARRLLADGALLIDVREASELAETGKISGAVHLPLGQLRERAVSRAAPELLDAAADRPVVLYCRTGNRSEHAAQLLRAAGYQSVHNLGGLEQALAAGLPRG